MQLFLLAPLVGFVLLKVVLLVSVYCCCRDNQWMRLATFATFLLITALEAVGLVVMMVIIRVVVEWQCDDESHDERSKQSCRDSQYSKDMILIVVFWTIFVVHVL